MISPRSVNKSLSIAIALVALVPAAQAGAEEARTVSGSRSRRGRVQLTFDDGPHPVHTPRLLDILKRYNVKATFFVVGGNARRYPQILRRARMEGHTIANHSDSHAQLTRLDAAGVEREVRRAEDAIVAAGIERPTQFRPPYGAHNSTVRRILGARGYTNVMWTCDSLDWKLKDREKIARKVLADVGQRGIVLLHDIHLESVESVPAIIEGLLERNLTIVPSLEALTDENASVNPASQFSLPIPARATPGSSAPDVAAATANEMDGQPRKAVITASSLNVREGPSTSRPAFTTVSAGTIVEVLVAQGGWREVRLPSGETGFVSARFLTEIAEEAQPPGAAAQPRAPSAGAADALGGQLTPPPRAGRN